MVDQEPEIPEEPELQEILLPPPTDNWQGLTSLTRQGPNRDWAPLNDDRWYGNIVDGVGVGGDVQYFRSLYESGDQVDAEGVEETVIASSFLYRMEATEEDGGASYPPAWDGVAQSAGMHLWVQHTRQAVPADNYPDPPGPIVNSTKLNTMKIGFDLSQVPSGVTITGARLRFRPLGIGFTNPNGTQGRSVQHVFGSGANTTAEDNHFCSCIIGSPANCVPHNYEWTEPAFQSTLEPAYLQTWSAEWVSDPDSVSIGDFKHGTSGDAASGIPVHPNDMNSTLPLASDGFSREISLSGWESQIENDVIGLYVAIDQNPTLKDISYWKRSPGNTHSPLGNEALGDCSEQNGLARETYQLDEYAIPAWNGTNGGFQFTSMSLVVEHAGTPVDVEKPYYTHEYDERGIVYFDLTSLDPELEIQSVDLLLTVDYAWASPAATYYIVPIDPTNPSHEGSMPVTASRHHPVGLEDKTGRSVWSADINEIGSSGTHMLEIPIPPEMLAGLEQIGFQSAIKPSVIEPWVYAYVDVMTDVGSYGTWTGPRLRIRYGEGTAAEYEFSVALSFETQVALIQLEAEPITIEGPPPPIYIGGEVFFGLESHRLQVSGDVETEIWKWILAHRAHLDRMN